MTTDMDSLKTLARQQARDILQESPSFHQMNQAEQMSMYKDVYSASLNKMISENAPVAEAMRRRKKPQKAADLIEDERHLNQRINETGDLADDFIHSVDFPGFVRDLLKGVFDANLEVTLKQMETYKDLMQAATASISKFVRDIDNTAAFGYLAEKDDNLTFDFSDDEKDENGNPQAVLTDKDGNKLDLGDNEIKAKIMDAKIAMAKEHRSLLREMILMGVTRLVVEKGTVKASVLFDIKAKEKISKKDRAGLHKSKTRTSHGGGSFFGFFSGGSTTTKQESQISVSSVKSDASTDLAAKVAGSVELVFKSDYFKLDNFAEMYAPQLQQQQGDAAAPPTTKQS